MGGRRDEGRSVLRLAAEGLALGLLVGGLAWWSTREPLETPVVAAASESRGPPPQSVRPFAERRPAPAPAAAARADADTGDEGLSAMVDRFAEGWDGLVCRVEPALGVPSAALLLDDLDSTPIPAGVFGDRLLGPDLTGIVGAKASGTGSFLVDGFGATPFTWRREDGRFVCDQDPVVLQEPEAGIVGYVVNAEGLPEGRVWVTGCGRSTTTDEDGAFFLAADPGACTLQGFRQDGFWQSRTASLDVVLVAGEDLEVDLLLPERPRGGVGVAIRPGPEGVVIRRVEPGGSAWEAGLEAGSVVLAIEGEAYDPWDLEGFVDAVTGEEGSDVELTLLTPDGDEQTVVLDRRAMGPTGS